MKYTNILQPANVLGLRKYSENKKYYGNIKKGLGNENITEMLKSLLC